MKKALKIALAGLVLAGFASTGMAQDLKLVNHGTWSEFAGADGINWVEDINAWIDIQVPNWSFHKTVGIVWTDNNWESANVAYAQYEFSYGNGYEQWGVDVIPVGQLSTHRSIGPTTWNGESINHGGWPPSYDSVQMQYAIFYTQPNGYTEWDNNNGWNHWLTMVE